MHEFWTWVYIEGLSSLFLSKTQKLVNFPVDVFTNFVVHFYSLGNISITNHLEYAHPTNFDNCFNFHVCLSIICGLVRMCVRKLFPQQCVDFKLQTLSTRPKQGERVWIRDFEYILHEILHWRAYNPPDRQPSQYGILRQNWLCCLAGRFHAHFMQNMLGAPESCSFTLCRSC